MSEHIVSIGPISNNPETCMKLVFGTNVTASRIMDFVERSAKMRERFGLITNDQVVEIIREAEQKIRDLRID